MFGTGLLKGLGVTIKHFVETYVDDVKAIPSRYAYGQDFIRQAPDETGLFTIQYPEEKRQLPERFRYIPMLIYDTPKQEDRCTACGICAKVCPPQCIWIVRDTDEKGKPIPRPAEFYIDASICMSCGFCAEFCPFDAIKMNHDYELAVYDRFPGLIYNMAELTVPLEYYASLYPTQFVEEEARRAEEEAKKAKKPARGGKAEVKPTAPAAQAAPVAAPAVAAAAVGATTLSAEELERRRAEAKARVAARKGEAAPEVAAPAAAAAAPAKPAVAADSPFAKAAADPSKTSGIDQDEIARKRAEAYARYQERKGADAKQLHGAAASTSAPAAPVVETPQAAAPAAPVAAAPAPTVTAGSPFAKAAADPSKTSGIDQDEIARKRAEAYARYQERKGADAKPAVPGPAPAPAAPPPSAAAPQPAAAAPAPPAAKPAAAAAGSPFAKMPANPARTSGGYTVDEIARRRAEAYARYKARKGADAKDLEGH
jgi:NADH-quinone oxidoreductase subunit I